MMLFQSPIVWMRRIRKRKGYGVHSPFAFDFVTNVLYNAERYYAYAEMDRNLHWWQKGRIRSMRHLLFRLSNYHRPRTVFCAGMGREWIDACKQGSKGAEIISAETGRVADMVIATGTETDAMKHVGEGTMLVLLNINRHPALWKKIKKDERITVTFDLHDVGIAFARKNLNREEYIINW